METIEAIKTRRSVRGFTDENVGDEAINSILEAGRWAPSGLNNQPWRFIVVRNPKTKVELSKLTVYGPTIKNAPVLVVVFLDMEHMYNYVKDVQSIGACIQNMLLCIHSLGLGGVWLGEILKSREMVNKILRLGANRGRGEPVYMPGEGPVELMPRDARDAPADGREDPPRRLQRTRAHILFRRDPDACTPRRRTRHIPMDAGSGSSSGESLRSRCSPSRFPPSGMVQVTQVTQGDATFPKVFRERDPKGLYRNLRHLASLASLRTPIPIQDRLPPAPLCWSKPLSDSRVPNVL